MKISWIMTMTFIWPLIVSASIRSGQATSFKLTVHMANTQEDTLYLSYSTADFLSHSIIRSNYIAVSKSGTADFIFELSGEKESFNYFVLRKKKSRSNDSADEFLDISPEYIFRYGDSIRMNLSFRGTSMASFFDDDPTMYTVQKRIFDAFTANPVLATEFRFENETLIDPYVEKSRHIFNQFAKEIGCLPKPVIEALQLKYKYFNSYYRFEYIKKLYLENSQNEKSRLKFTQGYQSYIAQIDPVAINQSLVNNYEYNYFLLYQMNFEEILHKGIKSKSVLDQIGFLSNEVLRSQLVLLYAKIFSIEKANIPQYMNIVDSVKDGPIKKELRILANRIPGSSAYAFSFTDSTGQRKSLSDFKGNIILMDFWFTGCGGCMHYATNVLSVLDSLYEHDTVVKLVSVCIDKNIAYWKRSLKLNIYSTPNSINLYTNGEGWDHPMIKFYSFTAYPSAILIGKDGRIIRVNTTELKNLRTITELIEANK